MKKSLAKGHEATVQTKGTLSLNMEQLNFSISRRFTVDPIVGVWELNPRGQRVKASAHRVTALVILRLMVTGLPHKTLPFA